MWEPFCIQPVKIRKLEKAMKKFDVGFYWVMFIFVVFNNKLLRMLNSINQIDGRDNIQRILEL